MLKKLSLLHIVYTNAGELDFDYLQQGADWKSHSEWECGSGNQ
jgi:hypothetical protein